MSRISPLRWTIARAGTEFGVSTKLIASNLKAYNLPCGGDGKWSSSQIVAAIFDEQYQARTALLRQQEEARRIENEESRGELVNVAELAERMNLPLGAMKTKILGLDLPAVDRDEILSDIRDLYCCIFGDKPKRPGAKAAMRKAERELAAK